MVQVLAVLGFLLGWVVAQVQAQAERRAAVLELAQVQEQAVMLELELAKGLLRQSDLERALELTQSQLMYRKKL